MHWPELVIGDRLEEVLLLAQSDGPQVVTRNGEEVAVIMSIDEYRELGDSAAIAEARRVD